VVEAKQYEKEKNYKECGTSYEAAAETISRSPQACRTSLTTPAFASRTPVWSVRPSGSPAANRKAREGSAGAACPLQIASGYHQIRLHSEAAKRYEEFATKFRARSSRGPRSATAYTFRIGVGGVRKAVDDKRVVKYYERVMHRTRPTWCSR